MNLKRDCTQVKRRLVNSKMNHKIYMDGDSGTLKGRKV